MGVLFSNSAYSQCATTETEVRTAVIGTHVSGAVAAATLINQTINPANKNSWYTMGVTTGVEYQIGNCATSFDPCLEARQGGTGGTILINWDDRNETGCANGNKEDVYWTSGFTGTLYFGSHHFGNTWPDFTSAIMTYRQSSTVSNTTSTATICQSGSKPLTSTVTGVQCAEASAVVWSIVSGGGSIGGTTYTPGAAGSVTVRATHGVSTSDVTFTVEGTPVAPTLSSASPASGSTICAGYNSGTVTGTGGSGGVANEYQVSINGGTTYSAYTNGAAINTAAATGSIIVQGRRTGSACSTTGWSTLSTWTLGTTPVAPTLSSASPANGSTVCAGFNTGTVTGTGGSGGSTGAANEYQVSINGGTTWASYTNGAAINTAAATGNIIVQSRRTGGSYGCTTSAWSTISTWTLGTTPVAPTLSSASPANGSTVCAGFNTGTVTGTGGSGGSTGAANEYQVSINGGTTWASYTNGAAINTAAATGSIIVQSRRTGGSYGCSASAWSTISTWTLGTTPTAPALSSASPANGSTVCAGFNTGTVTGAAGSGGSTGAADEYQVSINGGTTWASYTNGAAINTAAATGSIIVQSRRTGGSYGCSTSGWSTISTWSLAGVPSPPTLSAAVPGDGSTVCAGFNTGTITGTGGSGGSTGAVNEYQVSVDGGSTWASYTNGAAINTSAATGMIIVQGRRTAGSYGCTNSSWAIIATWFLATTPTAPTLSAASPVSGSTVCAGFNTGTVTGTGGSGGSTGATNEYQVSINGGTTWASYTSGAAINTSGATGNIIVQSRRTGGSYGCSASAWSTISTWTLGTTPTAPALSVAVPASGSTVCAGFNSGTVTGAAGSGGSTGAADEYQVSINGGTTWASYTNGAAINTAAATGSIIVQSRRTGGSYGCTTSAWSTISTWSLGTTPTAPALSAASPVSGSTVCAGFNTGTVTGAAGSGGSTGAVDEYQVSINGGTTWASYTNGAAINTAAATGSIIVQSRRTGGSYGCSASAWSTLSTWNLGATPTAPTLSAASPTSGTTVCAGFNTGTVTGTGGSGGSTGATNEYQVSLNGGTTWAAYTSGAAINTSTATGSIIVQSRRTGGSYGCSASAWSTISTWSLGTTPTAPALSAASPTNGSSICAGFNTGTVTGAAGSGGSTGAIDEYQVSINGGSTWASYTNGATITTTGGTGSVIVQSRRTGGTYGCTTSAWSTISTWTINPLPAAFTVNMVTSTPLCFRGTAEVQVPTSNASLSYQLRDNTTNVGSAQTGNGGTLSFNTNGLTATNANYNVLATNISTSCTTAVSAGSISVDAVASGYASNNDSRTCYVNSSNYVEFRSVNGIMIAINSNGQNLGNVTVTEYAGSPVDVQACNTYQPWYETTALGRHWKIEPQFQPASPVSIRTYFDNSDYTALQTAANSNASPNDNIAGLGSLDLSKYSNPGNPSLVNGTFTDNCGSGSSTVHTQTASGNISSLSDLGSFMGTGRYTQYSFTGFSEFWLSGTNNVSPLPIELTSFTATCQNGQVKLDWTTATEINNEKFIIDRSSDLQTWEEVLTEPGSGNTNQPMSYFGIDERPLEGLSYYRLTQRDYDGASETFDPISITCYSDGNGNKMMVYPNPATDRYTVSIYVTENMNGAELELTDMSGKLIMANNVNLTEGNNEFTYDAQVLMPGTYILYVKNSKLDVKPIKLVVK